MNQIFIVILLCMFIFLLICKIIQINSLENFADVSKCHGKRDGVSGCRTCCDQNYTDNYYQCVYECM